MLTLQGKGWESNNFELNPRQQLNRSMCPHMDNVYRSIFGNDVKVERTDHVAGFVLDKFFAVDTILTLPSGSLLTTQEKCLDTTFLTLTVEYMQNQFTQEQGDWYRLAAQLYFCGYASKDRSHFTDWVLVNWPLMVIETLRGHIEWKTRANMDGKARASFRYVHFKDISPCCIIAQKENTGR